MNQFFLIRNDIFISGFKFCFVFLIGGLRSLGKVTKREQGQIVVKNALKAGKGLRASRPNPKSVGNGLGETATLIVRVQIFLIPFAGLKLHQGHRGHGLPFLGFGLDALRPLSTCRAFFTTSWPWCPFVTLPSGFSAPQKTKILIRGLTICLEVMLFFKRPNYI